MDNGLIEGSKKICNKFDDDGEPNLKCLEADKLKILFLLPHVHTISVAKDIEDKLRFDHIHI